MNEFRGSWRYSDCVSDVVEGTSCGRLLSSLKRPVVTHGAMVGVLDTKSHRLRLLLWHRHGRGRLGSSTDALCHCDVVTIGRGVVVVAARAVYHW
jgi:hypothetical protein